jgi:hypothetical protein
MRCAGLRKNAAARGAQPLDRWVEKLAEMVLLIARIATFRYFRLL